MKGGNHRRDKRLEFTNPTTRYALVFSSQPNPSVIYDPKRVNPAEMDELYELLDPRWKGKAVLNDPIPAGAGGSLFRWLWRILGPDKRQIISEEFALRQERLIETSGVKSNGLPRGKYAWLLGPHNTLLYQLQQRGLKFGILPEFKDYARTSARVPVASRG